MSNPKEIKKQRVEVFLKSIENMTGTRVLDIGSQKGDLCNILYQRGYEPYGVEVMEEHVNASRLKYPQICFKLGDCEKHIPFENDFFDIIWAGDVIEHIRFTDIFVNELNRVLKTDGWLAISTPMHNRIKCAIISLFNFEKHFNPEFPHVRFYTLKSLKTVLSRRGFEILSVHYIGRIRPISSSMFVLAKKISDREIYSTYRY